MLNHNCFRAKLPAPFTLSEVVALLMSRDLLAPTSGSVLAPSVHAAFAKIRLKVMRTVIGVRALGAKLLLPYFFAVERIRRLKVTDRRFTLPADFDPERYLAGAWGLMRGQQVTIKVVFAPKIAPWIAERLWHPSQSLRWLKDKRLELTLKVADTPDIRRWLLGFGPDAEVVEPTGLRDMLRLQAEGLVQPLRPIRRPGQSMRLPESGFQFVPSRSR